MLSYKVTPKTNKNMLKRLLISFLTVIIAFFSTAPAVANAQWFNQNPAEWYMQVYDDSNPSEIFGERYTAAQVDWIIMSFLTWPLTKIVGTDTTSCFLQAFFEQTADIDACTSLARSLISKNNINETTSTASLNKTNNKHGFYNEIFSNNRELSGIRYVKAKLNDLNPVSEAYAQTGFGYGRFIGLTQRLWQASRNTAYSLFVIIAITISFMIMFRVKTSPQTVVTIQSSIPKIAIALVLVTFSYAIAGFLVDIMYVFIGLISLIFKDIVPNAFAENVLGNDTFEILTTGFLGTGYLGHLLFGLFVYPLAFVLAIIALPQGLVSLGFFVFIETIAPIAILVFLIMFVIMFVLLIFIYFKVGIMLIKTTATILLLVIFAPIQIALGVVAQSIGFGAWLKSMAANLAVFPIVGLMFTLAYLFLVEAINIAAIDSPIVDLGVLLDQIGIITITHDPTIPFGDGWPPLLSGLGQPGALILVFVSLTILFMIPKTSDLIKGIINGRGAPTAESALGEALALGGLSAIATSGLKRKAGEGTGDLIMDTIHTARTARISPKEAAEQWKNRRQNNPRSS